MKEMEMKRVPKLRFPEFTDDWEQRKLLELAEKTYGGGTPTTSNEAFWNGDIPWIQSSDVVDGKLFGVTPRKHITQSGLNSSAAQLIPKNSIAIITRVGVGKLAFMPYSYATSQDFLSLSKLNTEPFFTVYSCYKKLQSELNSVQGTSIKGITKDELLSKIIMVPEYAEQQQIGAFFSKLDNLITLHQRKFEKLKELKKGLVQKLFSQEVRFKADDGSEFPKWEEKKLGDVTSQYKVRNKKRLPLEIYSVNNIVGFIPQSEQFDDAGYLKDTDTSIYMVVPPKHFAYNPARLDIGSIGYQCLDHDVQVSSLYEVFETSDLVNDRFLWSWFHTYYFNNVVKRLQEGGVRLYFYYDKMQEVKIRLPSLPEQQKIADCLSSLDDGIAKQKATLAAWEELKKGLLQQMFV